MHLLSHPVTAVSRAQRELSAGTARVGMAAHVTGAAVNVQFDRQLYPKF